MTLALAVIALVATAASADGPPAPAVEGAWRGTEVPGFVVYGNVDESKLYEVANGLAHLRAVLAHTAAALETGSERPIPVFAFKSAAELKAFTQKDLDGVFVSAYGYRAIALDMTARGASASVYHELVHHVVHRNFGDVPLWFNEGIAGVYETFRCGTSTATVGWVHRDELAWFESHALLPVKRLAAVTASDADYNEDERAGTFYLESRLLVHDMLFGHPSRGPELAAYLEQVHGGRSSQDALDTAFTGGAEGLDAELSSYIKAGHFPYTDLAFSDLKVATPTPARTMSRTQTLVALGGLALVARPHDGAFIRAYFEAALADTPGDAHARAGMGAAAFVEEHYADALAHLEAAIAGGVDDPAVLVLGSRAIVELDFAASGQSIVLGKPASPPIVRARGWLERAIKAEPFDDTALRVYGETFVAAGDDPGHGIAAFERADAIDPLDEGSLYDLLELYVRRRDRTKAEAFFAQRIQGKAKPEIVASAREALLRLDDDDARDAIAAGDFEKAAALVGHIRETTSDEALRARMVELSQRIEAAAAAKKKRTAAAPKPSKR